MLCSCPSRVSQRIHVGANDIADSADFGVAVDFGDAGPFLVKAILQCLNCNIESDFVSELKTVGDSFRGWIDADRDALDLMVFNSSSQRLAGETYDSE